jgi:hypothetical protein
MLRSACIVSGLVFLFGCVAPARPPARIVTQKEAFNRIKEVTALMGRSPGAFVPREDGSILFDFVLPSGTSVGVTLGADGRCLKVAPFPPNIEYPADLSPDEHEVLTDMARRCAGIK